MRALLVTIEWGDREMLCYNAQRPSSDFGRLLALHVGSNGREQLAFAWPCTWELMCTG